MGGFELGAGDRLARVGAEEAHPVLDAAVLQHPRGGRKDQRGAAGAGVDRDVRRLEGGGRVQRDRLVRRQGHEAVAARDLDDLGLGAGGPMDEDGLSALDGERFGGDGLDAALEGAGLDRVGDVGVDARLECGEELVLLGDGEREQAVEELRHGRQLLLEPALVDQPESGRLLEVGERPAGDRAAPQREVELAERGAGVDAFEIVAGAEQRRVAFAHGGL